MSPNCIDVERIADVETAPEGHPLRQHVAECPRCQSLWLEYQAFMKADVTNASHIDKARRALEGRIRARATASGARDVAPRTSRMRTRTPWPVWLRPAIVTAVAALLTVVAVSIWRGGPETTVLRGGSAAVWSLQEPQVSSSAIVFEWKAVPDADSYDVEIFDDALNQVLHSAAVATTTITVDRSALSGVAAGAMLTWRVRALRDGDEIATSPPASVQLP